MNQQQRSNTSSSDGQNTMNLVMLVIQMYATSMEVFLHRSFGERYLGLQAIGVLILVPFHAYFLRDYDTGLLMLFIPLYLLACFLQRLSVLSRRWRGIVLHSRYNGFPWLLTGNTRFEEVFFKNWIEPFLVICGGALLLAVDHGLGTYISVAGVALFLKARMCGMWQSAQLLDMRDAMFEQQQRAERFRQMNG